MKFSKRLTRAAAAFLIFGMVASTLPTNQAVLAAPLYQNPGSGSGRDDGLRNVGYFFLAGFVLYLASRNHPFYGGDHNRRHGRDQDQQFNKLDRFTRPSDAGSNPNISH